MPDQVDFRIPRVAVRVRMAELDAAFDLSARITPPTIWLMHAIATGYAPANDAVERTLGRGGASGTILQLYYALNQTPAGRLRARELFDRYRDRYDDGVEAQIEEWLARRG